MTVDGAFVAAARAVVREAGRIAMGYFGGSHGSWEKGPGQIVTDADLAVDGYLKGALGGLLPDAAWLSEETEDDRQRLDRRLLWVVDPIDGTRSFAAAIPEFTVCVGLLDAGEPVLGFVLNPATGELYEAVAGDGAMLNGRPIGVTGQSELAGAEIVVSKFENRKRDFARHLPGATITSIGSLALKLCLVAAGRHDGYLTWRRTHDWDIAAALLVLREAGAAVSEPDGQPIRLNRPEPRHPGLVAANPALHRAILEATAAAHEAAMRPIDPR